MRIAFHLNSMQKAFLEHNTHLTPIMDLKRDGAVIVQDYITDEYNDRFTYILTCDCKVQSLATFVREYKESHKKLIN